MNDAALQRIIGPFVDRFKVIGVGRAQAILRPVFEWGGRLVRNGAPRILANSDFAVPRVKEVFRDVSDPIINDRPHNREAIWLCGKQWSVYKVNYSPTPDLPDHAIKGG